MKKDLSHMPSPPVLDYETPPPPRTLREVFIDLPNQALERFGGLTFTMIIVGLILVAMGMMIGGNGTVGMKIYAGGFGILGILFSAWTMK